MAPNVALFLPKNSDLNVLVCIVGGHTTKVRRVNHVQRALCAGRECACEQNLVNGRVVAITWYCGTVCRYLCTPRHQET